MRVASMPKKKSSSLLDDRSLTHITNIVNKILKKHTEGIFTKVKELLNGQGPSSLESGTKSTKRPNESTLDSQTKKPKNHEAKESGSADIAETVNRLLDDLEYDDDDDLDSNSSQSGKHNELQWDNYGNIKRQPKPKIGGRFNALRVDAPAEVMKTRNEFQPKPPPIVLREYPTKKIGELKEILGLFEGALLKITANGVTVHTKTLSQHTLVVNELKKQNHTFFTYAHRSQRPKVMIVRGIFQETAVEDIKADLQTKGPKPVEVYPMTKTTKNQRGEEIQIKLPSFTVTFAATTKTSDIQQIHGCCGYKVSWETKRKAPVTQCRRCQGFGHAASSCHMVYNCVKCASKHEPGKCPRNTDQNVPVKCCNCGGSHVASFSECPERLLYVSKLNKLNKHNGTKNLIRPASSAFDSNFIRPGVSFAETVKPVNREFQNFTNGRGPDQRVAGPAEGSPSQDTNSPVGDFFSKSQELFGVDFISLTETISDFMRRLNTVRDINTQKSMYLNFVCQYLK